MTQIAKALALNLSNASNRISVHDARSKLDQEMRTPDGGVCLCCGRHALVKRYWLNRHQVRTFIDICRETIRARDYEAETPWIHVEHRLAAVPTAHNVAQDWRDLRLWGLLEPRTFEADPSSYESGLCRVTSIGMTAFRNPDSLDLPRFIDALDERVVAKDRGRTSVNTVAFYGRLQLPDHRRAS